ncbi:MAG: RNA polymerase sigma factor (sigma-70 family) [Myxococcota bacterium]|jgi:RNA polymerase sigma factor (sigma-70 family)
MNAEEERSLAREIIAAEGAARALISPIPAAAPILNRRSSQKERTRSGATDRLAEAIAHCAELAADDPSLAPAVEAAQRELERAAQLCWRLAMSARYIARTEARKLACVLMDAEDLGQHGYIGLLSAARRFDPDREIRFTTYARWWVRAHMTRALENTGRTVRLPGGAVEQLRNLRRARERMEQAGESPNIAALAAEVGMDRRRAQMLMSQGGVVSLEEEGPGGGRVQDYLEADGPEVEPDVTLILTEELDGMLKAFDELLDTREKYILTHHYGLNEVESRSMSSIGDSIGISRERVRQIEVSALQRLRCVI